MSVDMCSCPCHSPTSSKRHFEGERCCADGLGKHYVTPGFGAASGVRPNREERRRQDRARGALPSQRRRKR